MCSRHRGNKANRTGREAPNREMKGGVGGFLSLLGRGEGLASLYHLGKPTDMHNSEVTTYDFFIIEIFKCHGHVLHNIEIISHDL